MATHPRIRPYNTFAVAGDGTRTRIRAHEIVLERPVGVDLELNLAPHPRFRSLLTFATFRGRGLLIEPGAANVAYLHVEDYPIGDRRRTKSRRNSRGTLGHVYLTDARGEKKATSDRTFVVETTPTRELQVEFCPGAPWARHIMISTPTPGLTIHLNAGNIVMFAAED